MSGTLYCIYFSSRLLTEGDSSLLCSLTSSIFHACWLCLTVSFCLKLSSELPAALSSENLNDEIDQLVSQRNRPHFFFFWQADRERGAWLVQPGIHTQYIHFGILWTGVLLFRVVSFLLYIKFRKTLATLSKLAKVSWSQFNEWPLRWNHADNCRSCQNEDGGQWNFWTQFSLNYQILFWMQAFVLKIEIVHKSFPLSFV